MKKYSPYLVSLLSLLSFLLLSEAAFAMYSPSLGRFIQRDPIGEGGMPASPSGSTYSHGNYFPRDSGLSGGSNRYSFVSNQALVSWDWLGLVDFDLFEPGSWEDIDQSTYDSGAKVLDVGAHGDFNSVLDQRGDPDRFISASELAVELKALPGFDSFCSVRLWSCNTGSTTDPIVGKNNFAQQLANELDMKVVAPEGYLYPGTYNDGEYYIITGDGSYGDNDSPFWTDEWKTFRPQN